MTSYKIIAIGVLPVIASGLVAMSQDGDTQFRNKKQARVLAENGPLIVRGNDAFPEDMKCEILLGPKEFPSFSIEGTRGTINQAAVHASANATVLVKRRATVHDSYLLTLFVDDKDGRVLMLYDLNMDGEWDVRAAPTREKREFILLEGKWVWVDWVDRILEATPSAAKNKDRYEFKGSSWIKMKTTANQ